MLNPLRPVSWALAAAILAAGAQPLAAAKARFLLQTPKHGGPWTLSGPVEVTPARGPFHLTVSGMGSTFRNWYLTSQRTQGTVAEPATVKVPADSNLLVTMDCQAEGITTAVMTLVNEEGAAGRVTLSMNVKAESKESKASCEKVLDLVPAVGNLASDFKLAALSMKNLVPHAAKYLAEGDALFQLVPKGLAKGVDDKGGALFTSEPKASTEETLDDLYDQLG